MADPVVTTLATGSSATATTTVSFTAQPAGTLLELKVGSDDYRTTSGANRPESTGWALATSGQDYLGAYVWYKLASGSETSVQYTIGSAAASQYELITYTNIDQTSPLGAVSSLHTHGGANTGTTAITPTSGARWTVSAFLAGMHSGASSLGPAAALSNSYTIQSTATSSGSPTEVGMSGYLTLDGGTATSTATVSPGWTTNSPSCSYGLLVAYKVAAGGTDVTVSGAVSTGSAAAGNGAVVATRVVTIAGSVATGSATALSGSVQSGGSVTVVGSAATGTGGAYSGTVKTGVTVPGSAAAGTGAAYPGLVKTGVTFSGSAATATAAAYSGATRLSVTVIGALAAATAQAYSGLVGQPVDITVTATLSPRRWSASLDERSWSGTVGNRRWEGVLT